MTVDTCGLGGVGVFGGEGGNSSGSTGNGVGGWKLHCNT